MKILRADEISTMAYFPHPSPIPHHSLAQVRVGEGHFCQTVQENEECSCQMIVFNLRLYLLQFNLR